MVSVEFAAAELISRADAAERDWLAELPELLNVIGLDLLTLTKLAYEVKSRGGTGSDGITWKPLSFSTILARFQKEKRLKKRGGGNNTYSGQVQIGVDSGLQRNSATPGFSAPDGGNIFKVDGTGVLVGYGRPYSPYFDRVRPLFPTALPAAWEQRLDSAAEQWGYDILARHGFTPGSGAQP